MKRILFLLLLLWSGIAKSQSCETFDTVRTNAASLITYNSARINGSITHTGGAPISYILKYVRTGQVDTASSSAATPLRNLTGLQASTEYTYYYTSVCPSSTVSQTVGAYTFTTLANTVNYTPMAAMGYQFKYLKADSGLMAPRRDTTIGRAPDYGGQIVWKTEDSTFYGYNGEYWHPLAIDSAGIITLLNDKVDSVTVAGDSLWYWKQGVSYGYILPTQANEWKLEGNSGTTAGTNFVGTTDNVDLVFKTNNAEVSRWNVAGALALGAGTDYGTAGLYLESQGSGAAPTWSTPPGVTSLAAIGAVANANGATISGNTLNLQPASASFGGVVTTGTQTFAGVKTFNSNIGIAGNAGASGDNQLIFGGNSTTFRRIYGVNSNAGNGAGVGMVLQNDIGNTFQLSFNSLLNLYEPDGAYIRTNGTGGYRFSHDGAGSKVRWSTSNATGIESGAYLGWDADEFYHIAIPQAASTSGKTVLLYDTASGGYFSQISLDSIGGSGGSGANTALSNLASVAINTSLISDANNTDDLGSASLAWRTAYLGTSAFVPLVIGGTSTTADLNFQTTTGAGTTGSFMDFLVGNNGAIRAMRINDVGGVGILAPTTIDANHGVTIKSPTNTGSHGLKILALNETVNMQIGWGIIEGSSTMRITAAGGAISLNSTSGVFAGGTSAPVATAILESSSTTKGWLPPRMTTTQKNAISSPAEGLIVYDTTLHKLCVYTGSAWETITSL